MLRSHPRGVVRPTGHGSPRNAPVTSRLRDRRDWLENQWPRAPDMGTKAPPDDPTGGQMGDVLIYRWARALTQATMASSSFS